MRALEITAARPTRYTALYDVRDREGERYATAGSIHTNGMTVSVLALGYRAGPRAVFRTTYAGRFWQGVVRRRDPFTERSLAVYAGKFARQVHKTVIEEPA